MLLLDLNFRIELSHDSLYNKIRYHSQIKPAIKICPVSRKISPTFVGTFEIKEVSDLNGRFSDLDKMSDFYRRAYNATLGHFYGQAKKMKSSPAWQDARKMLKGPERNAAFQKLRENFFLEKKHFENYVKNIRAKDIAFCEWTHSAVIQASVANRAFSAVDRFIYGKAKRLRFKEKGFLFSFEGKQNSTGVCLFSKGEIKAKIQGLEFKVVFEPKNPYHVHAIESRVKYARVIVKSVKGRPQYFIQGAFEGLPYENKERLLKHQTLSDQQVSDFYERTADLEAQYQGVVGLDFGPSYVHIATPLHTESIQLSEKVDGQQKTIRVLKRKLDRQRRAMNPQNYSSDGTIKKSLKKWIYSRGYLKTRRKIRDIERRKKETRKSSHGFIAHRVLSYGQIIKTEKVSYKGWQKIYGRSIGHHAPSALEGELTRKAGYARGRCEKINTYQTALSQTCLCGAKKKKNLSERIHQCPCGLKAHRDQLSAYLGIFCHKEIDRNGKERWALNLEDARRMFRGHGYLPESNPNGASIKTDEKLFKVSIKGNAMTLRGFSSEANGPILESSSRYEESGLI